MLLKHLEMEKRVIEKWTDPLYHCQQKNKKCEGYDRIPVCCLLDARHALIEPLAAFFSKVYTLNIYCIFPFK